MERKLATLTAMNSALESENEELRERLADQSGNEAEEDLAELQEEFERRLGRADKSIADLRVRAACGHPWSDQCSVSDSATQDRSSRGIRCPGGSAAELLGSRLRYASSHHGGMLVPELRAALECMSAGPRARSITVQSPRNRSAT